MSKTREFEKEFVPGSQFTVTMVPEEADIRVEAAAAIEGVSFIIRDPEDPSLTGYGAKMPGHVIGTTTAYNEDALRQYNKATEGPLRDLYARLQAKKDRQNR